MSDASDAKGRLTLPELIAWVVFGFLLLYITVGLLKHWPPPSKQFGLGNDPDVVNEWLGWAGVVGLLFAIWQLVMTASTAKQVRANVSGAMKRLDSWDISLDLKTVSGELTQAMDHFASRNLLGAAASCGRAEIIVLQIKTHYTRLNEDQRAAIDNVGDQLGSASSTARGGAKNLTGTVRDNVIEELRDQRNVVAELLRQLRG